MIFFLFVVLGIELRIFVLSYIPNPFFVYFFTFAKSLSCPDWVQVCDLPASVSHVHHYEFLNIKYN